MPQSDVLTRFLFEDTDVRGEIVNLDRSLEDALAHQTLSDSARQLFSEFLTAAALLSEVLKFEGILTLQAKGEGDVSLIMAETTDTGNLRGIVRFQENTDSNIVISPQLSQVFKNGYLAITIDPKPGQRYQGIVPLEKDNLAGCLEDYFERSEQLPTNIQLFTETTRAAGLFLQCLPTQLEQDQAKRQDTWETLVQLAGTLKQDELFELEQKDVLYRLFNEFQCRVFEPKTTQFKCSCSEERCKNALTNLGQIEAEKLLLEQGVIKMDCQFCGKTYRFNDAALKDIFISGSLH